ncbi:MAG: DNA methyltransferase [Sulfobacillus acidophilus]|uniref:site-specific DNA-methyltransferase (cytosine-N(4)-specific) n=1 Tax=Sulfobacillus acidophilus TaxID=53633 RepID=A0A2T2WDA3_9FIRM|nr:MAG: DNA methyltransferase [Sulfobacillus acidophilus]
MSTSRSSLLEESDNWDFRDADTKEGTHVIHSYPAMMIPQVARGLIAHLRALKPDAQTLLDPFCGAGTVLVEAARQGLAPWGNDLNPLALRIARVRTTPIDERALQIALAALQAAVTPLALAGWRGEIPTFEGRDFWFKPEVSRALAFVLEQIRAMTHPDDRALAEMAFSETVRLVSNTRNGEFKLYRMSAEKLSQFHPDVLGLFLQTLARYVAGLQAFDADLRKAAVPTQIVQGDTRLLEGVPDQYFDLMVTSPPYGDSRTTVAYGQFSRLSLEWLGLPPEEARTVDRRLLGGTAPPEPALEPIPSAAVQAGLDAIAAQHPDRAREVESFYRDLDRAVCAITRTLKPGALCAWVVANRTVKRVVLPTNTIIAELSAVRGYSFIEDLTRNIPNKRMPLANSPSNVSGDTGATMTQEHMVILRYDGSRR